MRECFGEETLQGYLDGELSIGTMESVTSHLALCSNCADVARELEKENNLVTTALAPEFEASVPSERLRERIDAAITGARIANPAAEMAAQSKGRGWFQSLSDLFTLKPQQAFGYAALAVVLTLAVIFAVIQRLNPQPATGGDVATVKGVPDSSIKAPDVEATPSAIVPVGDGSAGSTSPGRPRRISVTPASRRGGSAEANHVKLLPGERSYLQTIAELDSTIKVGNGRMRPAIQAEYERNLAFVDRALAAARTAAKSNPNDPDAAEFMFSAYQSKVDLLNTVADARVYNRER